MRRRSTRARSRRARSKGCSRAPPPNPCSGASTDQPLRGLDRFVEVGDPSIHLQLVDDFQDLADARAGLHAELEQMPPEQNRRGRTMLDAERSRALEEPV